MAKMVQCKGCGAQIDKKAKICPNCGRKNKGHKGLIILAVIIILIVISTISGKIKSNNAKKVKYTWPTSGVAMLLPEPESKYGKVTLDTEDMFSIDVYFVDSDEFNTYVAACKENGFTVDYSGSSSSYSADDASGNSLTIFYDEDDKDMYISIYAYVEKQEETETEMETEVTEESAEPNSEIEDSEDSSEEDTTSENVDFREWVDSYEEFMNKYMDFMENYDASDTSALLEYAELMNEMVEFTEDTENLNEDDYSVADWAYYMEAYARIMDRMSKLNL